MCLCVFPHDHASIRYVSCIYGYVTWVSMVCVCIGVFACARGVKYLCFSRIVGCGS